MTFLNVVAGKEHSMDHAIHSAEIISQCNPMLVGTGGLVLFPGTPLLNDAVHGEFTPLSEKEMLTVPNAPTEYRTITCRRGQKIPAVFYNWLKQYILFHIKPEICNCNRKWQRNHFEIPKRVLYKIHENQAGTVT